MDEIERIVHFFKPVKSENLTKSLPLSILPRGGRQPKQMCVTGPPEPGFQGAQSTPCSLCVEMGCTWKFPWNQDARVKLKSELISIKF